MRFYFEELSVWEAHVQKVFEEINCIGLPLVLFGRAKETEFSFLKQIQVPVHYICCNTSTAWGSKFLGFDVISPKEMQRIYTNYTVLVLVTGKRNEILAQLQSLPVPPTAIFQLDLHYGIRDHHMPQDSVEYFRKKQAEAELIYNSLSDQKSKDTYEAVIRYRMNRDINILTPVTEPIEQQYFPASLDGASFLRAGEVFVDAGAYIGDTVQNFLDKLEKEQKSLGGYEHIYAIEPEQKNYQTLLKNVQSIKNVTPLNYGLGDTIQQLYISSAGSGSMIVADKNHECIQVDTLDHLLGDIPVTYIKMDIEGMECQALSGAKGLIQKYHPKLAISCYHSDEDMVKVPAQILNLDPSYRLYMRHYTYNVGDTVCYAI